MVHPSVTIAYGPLQLRCEYFDRPMGLDILRPRLSWMVNEPARPRGVVQSAYQIQVASSLKNLGWDKPDLWDTGKVASSQSIHVVYEGNTLTSRTQCHWRVRTWNGEDQPSPWSQPGSWEMGLLEQSDWQASWIKGPARPPEAAPGSCPCPMLRKTFTIPAELRCARLYITARGLYQAFINGQPISMDVLTPGWMDFGKRQPYQTYDVTTLLQEGDNALGAVLGDGWYCGHVGHTGKTKIWGHEPWLLAQLELVCTDGRKLTVCTDGSWTTTDDGPIRGSDMQMGETFEAQRIKPGWSESGYAEEGWQPVIVEAVDWQKQAPLVAGVGPLPGRMEELKVQSITAREPGLFIADLGQNFAGWVRLELPESIKPGTRVTLRYGEILNPDGSLYVANLRRAKATDVYIAAGGKATWEPMFTFHGFRYVEVKLEDEQVQPVTDIAVDTGWVTGVVVYARMAVHGEFDCSHELVNQLQHNIVWGQKSNFLEVPTDCPQRDERLGWTGDAQVFIRTACFNMDSAAFYSKWLTDLSDAQLPDGDYPKVAPDVIEQAGGPGWSDAGVICPWTLYECYGDMRILDRQYPSMQKYIQRLEHQDYLTRHNYGDWLHHDAVTPVDLLAVMFHAHSLDLMSRIAGVLGKKKDATHYTREFTKVCKLFKQRFVTSEGRLVGDTQTAYVLALRFNVLPEKLRDKAAEYLCRDIAKGRYGNMLRNRNGHLSTGFLGVKDLNFALSDSGNLELAYQLLLNETYPSWLFPVKNGATTIWERWDGWTPDKGFQSAGMNSFNHYSYGAIGQWLYQVVAGLDLLDTHHGAGYRQTLIHPQPDPKGRINRARASTMTMYGLLASSWQVDAGQFVLEVTIPANTKATVRFKAPSMEAVREGGQPVTSHSDLFDLRHEAGDFMATIGSGTYRFETAWC